MDVSKKSLSIRIPEHLPPKQRRILEFIGCGLISKQMASPLRVSAKTVEYHKGLLMKNTGLRDIASLTKLAIRIGLTEIDV